MAMTVGKLKEWLGGLASVRDLTLPDDLPAGLGDLGNAVNIDALTGWFAAGKKLTDIDPDPDSLCLSGTIAAGTPTISLWFFAADAPAAPAGNAEGAEVIGVQIALSLASHPVLSVLSDIGLNDVQLVYQINQLDGATVHELAVQAELAPKDGTPLALTCALDFSGAQASFEFIVQPEVGQGWPVAAAFFGLFGAKPPPVLTGIELHRLMVAYDHGSGTSGSGFRVEVDAGFPLGDVTADLDLQAKLTRRSDRSGYDQEYGGRLLLDVPTEDGDRTLTFTVTDAQNADFTASCEDSRGVSLADLARLLGLTDPSTDDVLAKLGTITKLTVGYATARRSVVLAVGEAGGGSLVVVSDRPASGERAWVGSLSLGLHAGLSDIPLLHGRIPAGEDVALRGIGLLVASADLPAVRVGQLNAALTASDPALPLLPIDGMRKGLALTVQVQLPGRTAPTTLAVRGGSGGSGGSGGGVVTSALEPARSQRAPRGGELAAGGSGGLPLVAWIDVQRSIGPLHVRRVGAGYADGTVWVLVDASLGLAGLTVGVVGLGLGTELSDLTNVQARLDGLTVAYSRPPLTIKGGLVNRPPDATYDTLIEGVLAVAAQDWGLTALGAFARARAHPDEPSMFLFGRISGEFGGPPPIDITGIMAGFGLNTDLRLPQGDQVVQFPFLADMTTTDPDTDPLTVLSGLMGGADAWVRPASGALWFAAGLAFNVVGFLDGQALLVLEVGDDFAVAVLGTAAARFPKDAGLPAYAQARLGISATYRASERVLKVAAQLAPGSFLLSEACVLTGGFALYVWFDDAHAGDFVLTLGGYHPGYPVPAHYPRVPRLGFSWPVTAELSISGGSYFALTPGAIMAGGGLDVDYRSGNLHAWLTAHADILIEWAPFHFDAGIGVSIGVSYLLDLWFVRKTIRVEVGASLRLWGPPTAGEVTVHLWFVSFSIAFGDRGGGGDGPAPWSDVVAQLPAPDDAIRLIPLDGLTPQRAKDDHGGELWIAGPGAFSFAVRAAIPASILQLDADGPTRIDGHNVNIRPRRDEGRDLASVLTVTLTKHGQAHALGAWYQGDRTAQNRANLPAALWGPYDGRLTTGSAQRVDDQLMGVDLRLPPPIVGSTPGPILAGTIAHDDRRPDGELPLRQPTAARLVPDPSDDTSPDLGDIAAQLTGTLVDQSRDRLFAAMGDLGVSPGTNGRLSAEDALVAGDLTVKPAGTVPGTPTASERLYVLGAGQTVTPVDAQSLIPYEPFTLRYPNPTRLAVSPDGRLLCVAGATEVHVDVFDISANPARAARDLNPATPPELGRHARGVSFSLDFPLACVAGAHPNQVTILRLRGGNPIRQGVYDLGDTTPADLVSADRIDPWSVYVAQPGEDNVLVLDVRDADAPTPAGDPMPAGPAPTRLALDPGQRWLYALNAGSGTVTVIDLTWRRVIATLPTGSGPSALVASADGTRLYVAAATTGTVSVFDVSGAVPREAGEPVWVGPEPIALAVSTAGDRLYVARAHSREVGVVDVSATPPVLLPVTIALTDDPVALAVTVPPPVTTPGPQNSGGAPA